MLTKYVIRKQSILIQGFFATKKSKIRILIHGHLNANIRSSGKIL